MADGAVLIDTHVWLWMAQGSERLLETAGFAAIEQARSSGGVVISILSVWEVGQLAAKGRIKLRRDTGSWIADALQEHDLRLHAMTVGIALGSTNLPGEFHSDPADRILIATARELNIPLVTADTRILAYANSGHVRAIEV
jgi:PIN domain nuclease of toxin-antitoxin system